MAQNLLDFDFDCVVWSFLAFEGKMFTSFTWMNDSFALIISLNYRECQAKVVFKIHLAEAAGDLYRTKQKETSE